MSHLGNEAREAALLIKQDCENLEAMGETPDGRVCYLSHNWRPNPAHLAIVLNYFAGNKL